MDRYHPVRMAIDRVVDPLLNPIRRLLPQTGMLDLSPIVALILVQILEIVITRVLLSLIG
jgi:YggT family protein